jgi:DNA polymerase theta
MSATLSGIDILKKWLNAEFYECTFRPVPLQEYVKMGNRLYNEKFDIEHSFDELHIKSNKADADNVSLLCETYIRKKKSVLCFCSTKNWCE